MKKPEAVEDMAARFTAAATTPALQIVQPQPQAEAPAPTPARKPRKAAQDEPRKAGRPANAGGKSVPVFLKVPPAQYAELEAEATKRTKATGKGVTVQQIILERI